MAPKRTSLEWFLFTVGGTQVCFRCSLARLFIDMISIMCGCSLAPVAYMPLFRILVFFRASLTLKCHLLVTLLRYGASLCVVHHFLHQFLVSCLKPYTVLLSCTCNTDFGYMCLVLDKMRYFNVF